EVVSALPPVTRMYGWLWYVSDSPNPSILCSGIDVFSMVRKLRGPIAGCHNCVSIVVSCGAISCARAGPPTATRPARREPKVTRARHLCFGVIWRCLGRGGQGDGMLQDILDP